MSAYVGFPFGNKTNGGSFNQQKKIFFFCNKRTANSNDDATR